MDANLFYGKKTFLYANNNEEKSDESAFSDSDEDPDYSPLPTRPSTSLQDNFTDYSSTDDEVFDYGSTSTPRGVWRPLWKSIQNEIVSDNSVLIWQSALPESDEIRPPFRYFENFSGTKLLDHIVHKSNLFSVQKDPTKPVQLNKDDLETFLGCCQFMSAIKLPRSRMYWASETRISQVADVMPRNRWECIKHHFTLTTIQTCLQEMIPTETGCSKFDL